ncbi:mechanosensitive ion channel [Sulfurimonas sp. MAG313]|nr:mechanosensitive ion channel domain-containing protein [Sulfurimonas sp. MAG313]MDF1880525.1 mechanosensitive ion channel [Sulfurimonas sp. MAG313]
MSRKKFGKVKELDDKNYYTDSYSSRIFDILGLVFIIIITLYTIINIWEWTSLLETTGIFGLLAAFLALTNQIWAPDLYYGLVILNSKLIEDGDVITIGEHSDEYIINKVTFIYTTLLDIRNNHRTLIKNSQLIDRKIDNLSKRASTDGLRLKLSYKISYASTDNHKEYHERIKDMFDDVQRKAIEEKLEFNHHKPFEVFLYEVGDHALEYHLFFYLNNLPKTKITKSIRSILLQTPLLLNEIVLMTSYELNIDLSTPVIIKTTL